MEQMKLNKKPSKSEYVDLTRKALNELFGSQANIYRVSQISNVVAEKKGKGYSKTGVQSSVSRALVELMELGEVLQVEQGYVPNDIKAIRHILEDRMVRDIEYSREDVFTLSKKMMLIGVKSGSMDIAKRYFREYLGQKNCFDILEYGGYLVLLMVWFKKKDASDGDNEKEVDELLQNIKNIVKKGFRKEMPKRRGEANRAQQGEGAKQTTSSPKETETKGTD